MHALKRNPKPYIVGIAVLLIMAFYLSNFSIIRNETWQVRTVVHSEWTPEELAARQKFVTHGPQSFAIDIKGNLIVSDPRTNSFITYSQDGTQKAVVKLKDAQGIVPSRIEVDTAGLVYGISKDSKSIVRYNPDGTSLPVFSQVTGDAYYIESLGIFGSGTLYVQDVVFERDRYTRRLTRVAPGGQSVTNLSSVEKSVAGDSKPVDKTQIAAEVDDFVVARDGTLVVSQATLDPLSRTITRISPSGKIARFTIREAEIIRNCRLLGVDSQGNAYVALVIGKDPKPMVARYNPSGQKLSGVPLKAISASDISGRVDPSGNFYVTRTSESGYYIDKYVVSTQMKMVSKLAAPKK